MVLPTICPFNSLIRLIKKMDGSWRMMVDYHKLNHAVTPTAAAVPDVFSLLELITIIPLTYYAAIYLKNVSFSIPINKTYQK